MPPVADGVGVPGDPFEPSLPRERGRPEASSVVEGRFCRISKTPRTASDGACRQQISELLLLGVHRDDRLAEAELELDGGVEVLELRVAVGMARALERLASRSTSASSSARSSPRPLPPRSRSWPPGSSPSNPRTRSLPGRSSGGSLGPTSPSSLSGWRRERLRCPRRREYITENACYST